MPTQFGLSRASRNDLFSSLTFSRDSARHQRVFVRELVRICPRLPAVDVGFDLNLENRAAPAMFDGFLHVPIADPGVFNAV